MRTLHHIRWYRPVDLEQEDLSAVPCSVPEAQVAMVHRLMASVAPPDNYENVTIGTIFKSD